MRVARVRKIIKVTSSEFYVRIRYSLRQPIIIRSGSQFKILLFHKLLSMRSCRSFLWNWNHWNLMRLSPSFALKVTSIFDERWLRCLLNVVVHFHPFEIFQKTKSNITSFKIIIFVKCIILKIFIGYFWCAYSIHKQFGIMKSVQIIHVG